LKSVSKGKVHLGTEGEKKRLEEEGKNKEEEFTGFLQVCRKSLIST
jgi:hypothetical protein